MKTTKKSTIKEEAFDANKIANNIFKTQMQRKNDIIGNQQPLMIKIKNLTDEKIYNVNLFEDNYLNLPKLEYSSSGVSYKKLLDFVITQSNGNKTPIRAIKYSVVNKYEKFSKKQINCPLYIEDSKFNGEINTKIKFSFLDIYQLQPNMVVIKDDFNIQFGQNIILDYLMPETTVIIYFYPYEPEEEIVKNKSNIEESSPYVLEIKNLTDEKIYNVKVFDWDYEKTDKANEKVRYSCLANMVSYQQLLFELAGFSFEIAATRIQYICDYSLGKQTDCPIRLIIPDDNDKIKSEDLKICIDPYQNFQDILYSNQRYTLHAHSENNIVFDYLMPEATILLYLFPEKKISKV